MNDHKKQILQMLSGGKINVEEAERLLDALDIEDSPESSASKNRETKDGKKLKYLHVIVQDHPGHNSGQERVHIKVPLMMLKAGMKLNALMPEKALEKLNSRLSEKGFDFNFDAMNMEKLDNILEALEDCPIDIESDDNKVHIFCD